MIRKVVFVAILAGAFALQTGHGHQGAEAATLKIGIQSVLTGPGSPWGVAWVQGIEMLIEEINAKGGLKVGDKTYKIEYVKVDDKYSGSMGVQAANRLVFQERTQYVFGSIGTASTLTAIPIYNQNKVLNINCTAGAEPDPKLPYTFNVGRTAPGRVYAVYGLLTKALPQVKKIAIVTPSDETGKRMGGMIQDMVGKLFGIEVVKYQEYEKGTNDFYPVLSPVVGAQPDAIDTGGSAAMDAALMTKQARELGFTKPIFLSWSMVAETQIKIAGKYADESYGSGTDINAPWVPAETRDFEKRFREKYGDQAGDFVTALTGYRGAEAVFLAIEKAGTLDTTVVRDTLENLVWDCLGLKNVHFGGTEFYGIKRHIVSDAELIAIKDGKVVSIAHTTPGEVAQLPPFK